MCRMFSKVQVYAFLLFGSCYIITQTSAQVNITSSLRDRQYACPGERVSYVCEGSDRLMTLYAPPPLLRNRGETFDTTEPPGRTGDLEDAFTITLLSTTPFLGQISFNADNVSLTNFEIVCENSPDGSSITTDRAVFQKAEEPDSVRNATLELVDGAMKVMWNRPLKLFDLAYYEVQVIDDNTGAELSVTTTTSTMVVVTFSGTARARITAVTRCEMRSMPVDTEPATAPTCPTNVFDIEGDIAVLVVMSVIILIFVPLTFIFLCLWLKAIK